MKEIYQTYSSSLWLGFRNTLIASVIALIFATIIGAVIAIFQTSQSRLLQWIGNIYVEFFRNIPLLVIVMFFYVAVPKMGVPIGGMASGIVGLTIYTSSFIADVFRSGIEAVPKGQTEAGLSQGFSRLQVMFYIVLPQAIKIVIPPMGNQFINLVKNSSILSIVAGMDLMYYGDLIMSETFNTFDTYILVALFYLLITLPLTYLVKYLEKRLAAKA